MVSINKLLIEMMEIYVNTSHRGPSIDVEFQLEVERHTFQVQAYSGHRQKRRSAPQDMARIYPSFSCPTCFL